jgi:hypothetical protein
VLFRSNGAEIDEQNLSAIPKYPISGTTSSIAFNKFKLVDMGEGDGDGDGDVYGDGDTGDITGDMTQIRWNNLAIRFNANSSETDFGYFWPLYAPSMVSISDHITGTPKVQVTGSGKNRTMTIELDAPKSDKMGPITNFLDSYQPDVKITEGDDAVALYIWDFRDSEGELYLSCSNGSGSYAYMVYVDKKVTADGTYTEPTSGETFTFNNVTLQPGWNSLIESKVSGPMGSATTYTAARTLPSSFYWNVDG